MSKVIIVNQADAMPVRIDQSMELWRLIDGGASPELDFVITMLDGVHSRRTNRKSRKLYFVISGKMEITSEGGTRVLTAGGAAVVPPGVWCRLRGVQARVGIACAPAFDPADEEVSPSD